jgi:AcrR family transcriptional regulator
MPPNRSNSAQAKIEPVEIQSLRDEHKRVTRERLIDAAVELFAQNGFKATSVGEIARTAGTTPTTFYRYFTGKSDIARVMQDRINVEVRKHLEALDSIKRPTRQSVRAWVEQYGKMGRRVHELCNAYWEATSSDPQLAAELVPVTYKLIDSMRIVESIPAGKAREIFQARFVLMYLMLNRLFFLLEIQGKSNTATVMLDEFSNMLWETLFANR